MKTFVFFFFAPNERNFRANWNGTSNNDISDRVREVSAHSSSKPQSIINATTKDKRNQIKRKIMWEECEKMCASWRSVEVNNMALHSRDDWHELWIMDDFCGRREMEKDERLICFLVAQMWHEFWKKVKATCERWNGWRREWIYGFVRTPVTAFGKSYFLCFEDVGDLWTEFSLKYPSLWKFERKINKIWLFLCWFFFSIVISGSFVKNVHLSHQVFPNFWPFKFEFKI